jgi:hypothetical protein
MNYLTRSDRALQSGNKDLMARSQAEVAESLDVEIRLPIFRVYGCPSSAGLFDFAVYQEVNAALETMVPRC